MNTATLSLPAPAKLNLFLHVTGQRDDGYHTLQTLFQFLDYGDTLHFSSRSDGKIALLSDLPGVDAEDNLIVRAARLLKEASSTPLGADIKLDKILPMGGGIGGGSSDAATTLLGLNHLWQTGLSIDQLAELGIRLGADVPVFVRGHAAWAEGVGEQLTPVELEEPWFLVVAPDCPVSTAEIFSDERLTRNSSPITLAAFVAGGGRNDCLPVVTTRYPEIRNTLILLNKYCEAKMTGTGSCLFGAFPNEREADKVRARLPATLRSFVARGCNVSPLHRELQKQA
ncbi:4-(cytidine 5'-diphospho)-2-C-methyl-D-erythritol kinase [Halopseudomonas aestusnigri]|jgi:4-diphosphocytidyl-2-C-methyl-D-erythritol kinase|uniref:4-(cytidine 5'-diphospho)-2-C-methyl-D-erythritol kinase n=1 Tax=Halopseudomonas TaxID=2901189 RepID=UPI000C8BF1FC|nr:4-(cytidine 5'-diphospho)-2-C-methyl-D-erythritol kinase [Halopseudomonas aestusnigri]MAH00625.1 4-(cytidine 5'-diphospho)-2-C-methyl-D-erythritol kinase [Pseudomonadales bacterium]MAK73571.1 4-(cytidine 5'-diphospho)-2-C-methyl-D-erythritol kinase [Pseudomonadales bacterium]MAP77290.1 4-(cytidine 5'-diphospho)-2-C-methyl-D-erythritol kinase [Pseudomonadales bacterium]UGV29936.1 4-(cytidine 5'-diphospho)-2-C-methyl-D-erythritol kinase [Halopseudomonas aestusnigri]|tara:strand:- start:2829 stop:3680 length:852 start_codon:yes stop_codon:yes gene_type:complete